MAVLFFPAGSFERRGKEPRSRLLICGLNIELPFLVESNFSQYESFNRYAWNGHPSLMCRKAGTARIEDNKIKIAQ